MSRYEVIACVAFLALAALLAFVATRLDRRGHADCEFIVRLDGRAVDSATGAPIPNAIVMAFPDRGWAVDPAMVKSFRKEMQKEISSHNQVSEPEGLHPVPIFLGGGVGMTDESGAIGLYVVVPWFYEVGDRATQREQRPPKRYGIEVLRIEIEGRDPVILDVPEGTWTEHPEQDDRWATWDLGVVEVPSDG